MYNKEDNLSTRRDNKTYKRLEISRSCKMLSRFNEKGSSYNKIISCLNEILSRYNEILFSRYNEI